MPAPAVYVIAVLGTVAVGFAFKEFVYDPHIAPKVAQWRHDYTSRKEARRRRRMPVAVSVSVDHDPNSESDDDSSKRGQSGGFEMESLNPSQTRIRARTVSKEGIESWRTGIQSVISATSLRKRNHTGTDRCADLFPLYYSVTEARRFNFISVFIDAYGPAPEEAGFTTRPNIRRGRNRT
ncbi:hypothetical protein F5890DRAFT_1473979 [Lentinula detonsa]|uniref:Uncharacterized protein n=1 Tax=Lentinula detonsa TaxID=2804962 RepID=A0AA38USI0_9AGAR|nr:hypothetical protein F5890DRAFT_1473979 [Lentinula detonsa]